MVHYCSDIVLTNEYKEGRTFRSPAFFVILKSQRTKNEIRRRHPTSFAG